MLNPDFRPDLLTKPIIYCLREDCSRSHACLHHLAFRHAAPFVTALFFDPRGDAVGEACPHFSTTEQQRLAYGFRQGRTHLRLKDRAAFQTLAEEALGCGRTLFYEYLGGTRPISPSQQEKLRLIFAELGVTTEPFDGYADGYVLPDF